MEQAREQAQHHLRRESISLPKRILYRATSLRSYCCYQYQKQYLQGSVHSGTHGAMYELTYFGSGGRAFAILCALHKGGLPCKLNAISYGDFLAAKAEGLYKTGLPVLKLPNGKEVTQSFAVARYVSKLPGVNLYPTDPEAALQMEIVMDIVFDLMAKAPQDDDKEKKAALRKEFAANKLLAYSKEIENAIGNSTYVAGEELSIGDLAVYFYTNTIVSGDFDYIPSSYFADYGLSKLERLHVLVQNHPVKVAFEKSLGAAASGH